MCDCEDICFIRIERVDGKFQWLLDSIYLNCVGGRREENVKKVYHTIQAVVNKAKHQEIKILFGGDINAHIWKLDTYENGNGRVLKQLVVVWACRL